MAKKYDVVAVTGIYTNQQGEEKKRYQNVGVILDSGNGPFLLLEQWFNPAGVQGKDGKIVLSLYEPKMKEEGYQAAKQAVQQRPVEETEESEIPF